MNENTPLTPKDKASVAFLRLLGSLPLGLLQAIGRTLGFIVGYFPNSSIYKTVLCNLQACFPEQGAEWHHKTARATIINTLMTACEFAKTWHMPPEYSLKKITAVYGAEHFHEALGNGKGVIALIPHWGTWEFMNAWVNQYTAPIIMYKPGKLPGVDQLVLEARARLRAHVVPTDDSGVRATFKALKKGGFTAILPDHIPHDQGGVYATFFGIETWSGVMVPKLAHKTGCNVIVMGCRRRPDGDGFEIHILPALEDVGHEDIEVATAAMNSSMEALIRFAPEQYQWSYKRFKKNKHVGHFYNI